MHGCTVVLLPQSYCLVLARTTNVGGWAVIVVDFLEFYDASHLTISTPHLDRTFEKKPDEQHIFLGVIMREDQS